MLAESLPDALRMRVPQVPRPRIAIQLPIASIMGGRTCRAWPQRTPSTGASVVGTRSIPKGSSAPPVALITFVRRGLDAARHAMRHGWVSRVHRRLTRAGLPHLEA